MLDTLTEAKVATLVEYKTRTAESTSADGMAIVQEHGLFSVVDVRGHNRFFSALLDGAGTISLGATPPLHVMRASGTRLLRCGVEEASCACPM